MNKRGHVVNALLLAIGLGFLLEPSVTAEAYGTVAEIVVPLTLGALFPDVDTVFGRHRKATHNVFVLGIVVAYPLHFGNLQWVWVGVLTHYVMDVLGTRRGIAFFYPLWNRELGLPVGVSSNSLFADLLAIPITAVELGVAYVLLQYGTPYVAQAQQLLA